MDEAEYFDFVKSGAADEESFDQEYMCIPADDDAKFLEYGLITACEYQAAPIGSEAWRCLSTAACLRAWISVARRI